MGSLWCYHITPYFLCCPSHVDDLKQKKYSKTINSENKPPPPPHPQIIKKALYAKPLSKSATGSLYLRILVLVLDLALVVKMMDAHMRKFSSFAGNCNKQNKGSVLEFHMLNNYSASDRFDFNFKSNMLDAVWFGCSPSPTSSSNSRCWIRLSKRSGLHH